ncbi:MAG: hypothetical protein ACOX0D_07855 [Sphaerochaeta sp.]
MIMVNTADELSKALAELGLNDQAQTVAEDAQEDAMTILDRFVDPKTALVREIVHTDGNEESLLSPPPESRPCSRVDVVLSERAGGPSSSDG